MTKERSLVIRKKGTIWWVDGPPMLGWPAYLLQWAISTSVKSIVLAVLGTQGFRCLGAGFIDHR